MHTLTDEQLRTGLTEAGSKAAYARTLDVPVNTLKDHLARRKIVAPFVLPPAKLLCIDIETRPSLAYVWGMWDQNIGVNQLVSATEMFCWAAKWLGDPRIHFRSAYHHGRPAMVQRAWEMLDEADAVIHYNGQSFDVPHLNREFLEAGMSPPSPFAQIDLIKTVRRRFRFQSNKLAHVSQQLGLEGKVEHEGFPLWVKCINGDAGAWRRMREYNKRDTELLEDLYLRLRPWITSHPSFAAHIGKDVCPKCGSPQIEYRGYAVLRTARYRRFRCSVCGAWGRSTKRVDSVTVTETS